MQRLVMLTAVGVLTACGGTTAETEPVSLEPVYLRTDDVAFEMDVRVPEQPGPWPVVVAFHGVSSAGNDADDVTVVADAAAAEGLLVFTPEWLEPDPFPIDEDSIDLLRRTGACAVAAAQARAAQLGGDSQRTVVNGFSAGTGPAVAAILGVDDVDLDGCAVDQIQHPVRAAVLGDGEYFWQSANFDAVFADAPDTMRTDTERTMSSAGLAEATGAHISLWYAADGTAPRSLSNADRPDWLDTRDPDGSIRTDLAMAGLLDDGVVDYADQARLFERRLGDAGALVTVREFPGGHTTLDKVADLVALLSAAAAEL